MNDCISLAIIGCGAVTREVHLPALEMVEEIEVDYLIDINIKEAEKLSKEYAITHFCTDYRDVIGRVDAAIVALPHHLHYEISMTLMKNGINILCEKPLALNSDHAKQLVDCAKENGVVLNVGVVRRYYWNSQKVKNIILDKKYGALESIEAYEGGIYDWPAASDFFFSKEKSGGGVLIDTGSHTIDMLNWWVGESPNKIEYCDDNYGEVEAECFARLSYPNNIQATARLSRITPMPNKYLLKFQSAEIVYYPFKLNILDVSTDSESYTVRNKQEENFHDFVSKMLVEFADSINNKTIAINNSSSVLDTVQTIDRCYSNVNRLKSKWYVSENEEFELLKNHLQNKKILITGASGFIGSRIAEKLFFEFGTTPICAVKNYAHVAKLCRFPTNIISVDILNKEKLDQAMEGCDYVIHCAFGNTSDRILNHKINVDGTRNVLEAAKSNNVKKVVLLSTVEVYGQNSPEMIDESLEPLKAADDYGKDKLEAEEVCREYVKNTSVAVDILRPGVVYGPYAKVWTEKALTFLGKGDFVENPDLQGYCNLIYIDDLVQAVFHCLKKERGGGIYNVSSSERYTWVEYFKHHSAIFKNNKISKLTKLKKEQYLVFSRILKYFIARKNKTFMSQVIKLSKPLVNRMFRPSINKALVTDAIKTENNIYSRKVWYLNDAMITDLGYTPKTNLYESMSTIKDWVEQSGKKSLYT